MTPVDLANRYTRLRQRVSMHVPNACGEVSVLLPANLEDEMAFYRLVNWAYIVLNEAAKVPLAFLMALPPLQAGNGLRTEVGRMRTFVAHNLDVTSPHDRKTYAFAHSWFREACGVGTPTENSQFSKCSEYLGKKIDEALQGAIAACDVLDHLEDGPSLVTDLQSRINLQWDAHLFDPILTEIAAEFGNPGLDLLSIRSKNLDAWRKTLATANEADRERALRLKIEATVIAAIADTLPLTTKEISERLVLAGQEVVIAAMVILRDVRRFAPATVSEIIDRVGSEVLGSKT
ncbi:hypothetical protein AB4099_12820 [Bosea sp. 2KB_26]|uniref:hypothetical protein n=1 Tax=Bosea sp. 2KB_26 TaxID=3237475 RepID=UPI003F8F63C6